MARTILQHLSGQSHRREIARSNEISTSVDSEAASPENLAVDAFTQRIAVIIRLPDDIREIETALNQFSARQWVVNLLAIEDDPRRGPKQRTYRVEIRLRGAKMGARAEAEKRLAIALDGRVKFEVVQSTHIVPGSVNLVDLTYWHMYHIPPWSGVRGLGWIAAIWIGAGRADVGRCVTLEGPGNGEEARTELARNSWGGVRFDAGVHDVRASIGPKVYSSTDGTEDWWHGRHGDVLRMAATMSVMLFGWLMSGFPLLWQMASAVGLVPVAIAVGHWLTGNDERPRVFRWTVGIILVGCFTALGYEVRTLPQEPGLASGLAALGGGWFVLRGSWHAFRQSWFSRNTLGVLSIAALPLPFVLPFVGHFVEFLYLRDGFGIPTSSVDVEVYWTYVAGMEPVAWCAAVLIVCAALVGWARHFYWFAGRFFSGMIICLIAVVYVVTVLSASFGKPGIGVQETMEAMRAGHAPNRFFGLVGHRVCVDPVIEDPAVQNGPLPTHHPLLTFGASGGELWLWNPKRNHEENGATATLHVPKSQVKTSAAPLGSNVCPDPDSATSN